MIILAVSNLTQRKVRSILSVLAVAFAIALMLILWGLSHGTLADVSNRMKSVQAEIVVRDKSFDLGSMSGGKLWEKEIPRIMAVRLPGMGDKQVVKRVMPVFLGRMKLAGLSQNVFGIKPGDFAYFRGSRRIIAGKVFEDVSSPIEFIRKEQTVADASPGQGEATADKNGKAGTTVGKAAITNNKAGSNSGVKAMQTASNTARLIMPVVIDERLAQAGHMHIGSTSHYGSVTVQVVGIVQTGVAGRVFAPINILRAVNGISAPTAHMFFVKAADGLTNSQLQQLCQVIHRSTHRSATLVANYGQVLSANFRSLTIFVNMVSLIALIICFLFILVTMYTMVLERGREIAILQSLGATRTAILLQTMQEAFLICCTGTLVGIALTFGVRRLVQSVQPLMTIAVHWQWLLIAILIGLGGGCLSALYPSYLALKHDPVEVLNFD